ncbi:hypothetical protein COB18_03085 [Candidatus Kaiserbacteria bacterium]|nr:MAG: hypothetical protein COB18_03085 [Candidatus Kaiserbacteria bacterium]
MFYIFILVATSLGIGIGFLRESVVILLGSGVSLVLGTLYCMVMIIEPGEVGFLKAFGNLSHTKYEAGTHWVNPFATENSFSIRRQALDFTGGNTADGLTKNRVALAVDITVPWILNPSAASVIYERYGSKWNLIAPSGRKAIRDCISLLDWEESVSETGRAAMTTCVPTRMKSAVMADLISAGLTSKQAEGAFTFPDALVRKMIPKDQRILSAIAEEQAAVVDLRRQTTLTSIASEEANRRANEGLGIRMMMEKLPSNYTVLEMVAMIEANAHKTSAEAFLKAVEGGNPNITVITGGSTPPVTVPTH